MRDTAFKRGTAYLERYCLLIAFTSFLERTKGSDITFQASPGYFYAASICRREQLVLVNLLAAFTLSQTVFLALILGL